MFTSSISSPFSLLQPFLKDFDSGIDHNTRNKQTDDSGDQEISGHSVEKLNSVQYQLLEDIYHPTPSTEVSSPETVDSRMAVEGFAASMSESAHIQVITQEGDIVTISLNQSAATSRSAFHMEQGNNEVTGYTEYASFESDFSMSIEGDLNEDEKESLAQLIKKMNTVSHDFFRGDVKAAFKHAQKIGFDSEQISSFSMDLNMTKSVQAVVAYQQTTMPEQNINTDMLKQASEFLAQTKAFMADTYTTIDSLAKPEQSFYDLFTGVGGIYQGPQEDLERSNSNPLFLKLIENIANDLFNAKEDS